jgi:uncharacterized protein (TIGR02246 family)
MIQAETKAASKIESISNLVADWGLAWNRHRMGDAARLVAIDVDFVNVAGRRLKGRAEFLEFHQEIHQTQMRDSVWTTLGHEVRFVRDDIGIVHVEWRIEGDRNADGSHRAARLGVFSWLVASVNEGFEISAAHNTNLGPGVAHRIAPY